MLAALLLALGLAMDAVAVAALTGLNAGPDLRWRRTLRMPLCFGAFQAGMPLIGWLAGEAFVTLAVSWLPWIASAILVFLGGKMLITTARTDVAANGSRTALRGAAALAWRPVLLLSIATSLDALAAGLTLPLLTVPVALAVSLIGVVTFLLAWLGFHAGRRFHKLPGHWLGAVGGLCLIGLGVKIVLSR